MKKIIFIAGPVRGDGSKEAQYKNIEVAKEYVRIFIENEIPFYSPHLNVDQEYIYSGKSLNKFSLDLNTEFFHRCDALAVLPGWETSSGTKTEIENATKKSMPIFYLEKEEVIPEILAWMIKS
jgi:hypothetical protein